MHFKNLDVPFLTLKGDYASVAILIFEKKDILFIKRSDHLPTHKGHIAFPGGKKDNSDLNIAAAIRMFPKSAIKVSHA